MYLEAWEWCVQVHMYVLYIRLHVMFRTGKIPQNNNEKQQQIAVL